MSSQTSFVTNVPPQSPLVSSQPSRNKSFLFAIAIIVGIGGMVVAGMGLGAGIQSGWWHAGSISTINQLEGILMMSLGGGGGLIILALLLGIKKNQKSLDKGTNSLSVPSKMSNYNNLYRKTTGPEIQPPFVLTTECFDSEAWKHLGYEFKVDLPLLELRYDPATEIPILIPPIGIEEFRNLLKASKISVLSETNAFSETYVAATKNNIPSKPHWIIWKKDGVNNKTGKSSDPSIEESGYELATLLEACIGVCAQHMADQRPNKDNHMTSAVYLTNNSIAHTIDANNVYDTAVNLGMGGLHIHSTMMSTVNFNRSAAVKRHT